MKSNQKAPDVYYDLWKEVVDTEELLKTPCYVTVGQLSEYAETLVELTTTYNKFLTVAQRKFCNCSLEHIENEIVRALGQYFRAL